MPKNYRRWLRQQLAQLDELQKHPDPDHEHYLDIADTIHEARRRAAIAGLPDAVKACRLRRGGLTVTAARMILQSCLASAVKVSRPQGGRSSKSATDAPLSIAQAAEQFNLNERTLYALCADGSLKHTRIGRTIRIAPAELKRLVSQGPRHKAGLLD